MGNQELSLVEQIAALKAENEALKTHQMPVRKLTCKVGAKGGVSVYGIGRFPVSLYKGQWEYLINNIGTVSAFIAAHPELKTKPVADTATTVASSDDTTPQA